MVEGVPFFVLRDFILFSMTQYLEALVFALARHPSIIFHPLPFLIPTSYTSSLSTQSGCGRE